MDKTVDVVLALPAPPPFAGPEMCARLLLDRGLGPDFRVHHVQTNVSKVNDAKGKVTLATLVSFFGVWISLLSKILLHRPRIVFLYMSQNKTGFVRDAVLLLTGSLFGAKVVAQVHGSNFSNFYDHAGPLLKRLIRLVVRRLSIVIVLAERFRGQFDGLVPDSRVRVLYNAVDPAQFGHDERRAARRDSFTILFIGHLSKAKGVVDLLRAAPRVLDAVPHAGLVLAGEWQAVEQNILFGEQGRPIGAKDDSLSLWAELCQRYGNRLRHIGVVSGAAKAGAFHDADVLVLPSYSEGFPMAVLEGMAAGLPVVVTPVGALPEVLREGLNCRFVAPGDVDALAQSLIDLAWHPEEGLRMGRANRDLVAASFTPDVMVQHLAGILKDA